MSKIVVVVEKPTNLRAVISLLREATGRGMGDLDSCLKAQRPVAEYRLFENDHREVALSLQKLLDYIPSAGATLRLFELQPDAVFESAERASMREITPQTLRGILASHADEVDRQME